jgi:hypothetical protein
MSQEYVERVRRGFERFAETGEAGGRGLHPDVEVFDHDIPDARNPYRGAAGFKEWLSDFAAAWDRWDMEIERLIDHRADGAVPRPAMEGTREVQQTRATRPPKANAALGAFRFTGLCCPRAPARPLPVGPHQGLLRSRPLVRLDPS